METPQQYQSEAWNVRKDTVYAAISAVGTGIEYARVRLKAHDRDIGRTTQRDLMYAETMERHIQQMEAALKELRECGPS